MSEYLSGLQAFAAKFNGSVEFTTGDYGTRFARILVTAKYEEIPTIQDAYALFGASRLSVMAKPNMDGTWEVAVVSLR